MPAITKPVLPTTAATVPAPAHREQEKEQPKVAEKPTVTVIMTDGKPAEKPSEKPAEKGEQKQKSLADKWNETLGVYALAYKTMDRSKLTDAENWSIATKLHQMYQAMTREKKEISDRLND